jgi:hypothetical protein
VRFHGPAMTKLSVNSVLLQQFTAIVRPFCNIVNSRNYTAYVSLLRPGLAGGLYDSRGRSRLRQSSYSPRSLAGNFYERLSVPRAANAASGKPRCKSYLGAALPAYPGCLLRWPAPGKDTLSLVQGA